MRFQLFASLVCLPLVACLDEGETETEELSTTESNLCSDGAADAVVAFDDYGGQLTETSALPTNSYDHPACSDRFTVEVTGVSAATQEFRVAAYWGESLPNTQSACELTFANVQTHEYKRTSYNCGGQFCVPVYSWLPVGPDVQMHGEWQPYFDFHVCRLVPNSPLPVFQPSTARSKVRVAVRAYAWAVFFPVYKKAEAGVNSPILIP